MNNLLDSMLNIVLNISTPLSFIAVLASIVTTTQTLRSTRKKYKSIEQYKELTSQIASNDKIKKNEIKECIQNLNENELEEMIFKLSDRIKELEDNK